MRYTIRQGGDIYYALKMHDDIIGTDPVYAIKEGSVVWYVYHQGEIVGYATARELDGYLYMSSAGVNHRHRGKGLQKRLIRVRVKYAKSRGLKSVITYTSADNSASMNSLIACGFRVYNPAKAWVGVEWVYWMKVIS